MNEHHNAPEHEHHHEPPEDEEHVPDQHLFEPDEKLENRSPSTWERMRPYVLGFVAVLALSGIVYLSGLYQAQFLTRTPADVQQEPVQPQREYETIRVPLTVFLVSSDGSLNTERSRDDVEQLITNANAVWNQAGITFTTTRIQTERVDGRQERLFYMNPEAFMQSVAGYNPNTINVFLTGTLGGINGVAIGGTTGVAVSDFTSGRDYRTFAHELGHVLGLEHTDDHRHLMSQGTQGTNLQTDEVTTARSAARQILKSSPER